MKLWTELPMPHRIRVMLLLLLQPQIMRRTGLELLLGAKAMASRLVFGIPKLAVPHRLLNVRWVMMTGPA